MDLSKAYFHLLLVSKDTVVFRENPWQGFFILPLVMLFVIASGLRQYFDPSLSTNPPELWQLGALGGGMLLITALLMLAFGRSLRIDAEGVTEKFLFRTRFLRWRQIRDFGFSSAAFGTARLYFADDRLEVNCDGRKKRAGRCCSIRLHRFELGLSGGILNVCRRYTRVRPYLCTEDGKLLGKLRDR